jgi:hypothetical protein
VSLFHVAESMIAAGNLATHSEGYSPACVQSTPALVARRFSRCHEGEFDAGAFNLHVLCGVQVLLYEVGAPKSAT